MNGELCLRNRQRTRPVDLKLLQNIVDGLLAGMELENFDLAIHLVGEAEMTRLNETRLRHAGSTDVITFDYSEPKGPLVGEIFVCVDEALVQSGRFRVSWQEELVRYIVHGVLHLQGHDDLRADARRRMKRAEGAWLKKLARDFRLSKLWRKPKLRA